MNSLSEQHTSAAGGSEPDRRQEIEPVGQADGEVREESSDNSSDAEPADQPEEESVSREEERAERNAIRNFRTAGLRSLRPAFSFSGATSFGGYAAERDINIYASTATRTSTSGPVPADELADLRAFYVPFEEYDVAHQMLVNRRVLVLRGEVGSGRRTSALALLTNLVGEQIIDLGHDRELEPLLAGEGEKNCGYVLCCTTGAEVDKLTQPRLGLAERMLGDLDSFLVITLSGRSHAQHEGLERYLVDHQAPDLNRVIQSHLYWRCRGSLDPPEDWLADPRLVEQVAVATQPRAMANLATELVQALKCGRSVDDALDRVRQYARIEAQRLLRGTGQAGQEFQPTEQLQRCALLIALAVFNDAPYLPVAAAAESLAQLLIAAAYPRSAPDRQIFALRRNDCIRWLQGTIEHRRRSNRAKQSIEHIRLRNPDLPSAILHELWHEYDATRPSVLRWVQDLANRQSAELRVRAAQAVGKLATDDFEYVYQEVISGWAGSRFASQREAAAWALEVAFVTGDTEDRIRQLLRDWCRSGTKNRQLTAVTTYGTRIGASSPEEALRSLLYLARSEDIQMTRIACNSVVELFAGGQHEQVLDTLQKWLTEPDLTARRFTVASLVQIAYLRDDSGRPLLLPMCGENHPRAGLLARLWRHGLGDDYAKADAWEALRQWFLDADQNHDLFAPLAHLVNFLEGSDTAMQVRLDWYLRFWATHPKMPSETARMIGSASRRD